MLPSSFMKAKLPGFASALAGVALAGALTSTTATFAGCGSAWTSSGSQPEDATTDVSIFSEASNDALGSADVADASGLVDAADVSTNSADAQPEVTDAALGISDAADVTDAATELTDSASDVTDATVDVQTVAPSLDEFTHAVDYAYCVRIQQCCLTGAAQWNTAACAALFDSYGSPFRTGVYQAAFDGGYVGYKPAQAVDCLQEIAAFNCVVTAQVFAKAVLDCNAAIVGLIGIDAGGCRSSVECAAGAYCNVPEGSDSGIGSCLSLQQEGQPCTNPNSEQCTYLGNGEPPLFCGSPGDGGPDRCTAALGVDAGCSTNAQCQSGLCGGQCLAESTLSDPGVDGGFCQYFAIVDAGSD
jgi:hypothetical protein